MRLPSASRLSAPLVLLLTCAHAAIVVNASKPPAAPQPLSFAAGGRSPDGRALAINSRYLTVDGQPWFPVMGEFQYSRYPAEAWETELLKMKAGGVRIVSTYIFWIHHEEVEGQFDWSGRRDLRRFVELAGRHGLMVWARVGPWNHGEVRNGGLPDWVLRQSATRRNDPAYLKSVARFYGQIGGQLKGLFWKEGGPIAGVQIENEYHETTGPGAGPEHILTLKRLAREAGLEAPFYSITGWDNAAVPARDVVPVFGGYPDGFWYRPLSALPPSPNYFFTPIRCEENVGPDLCPLHPEIDARFRGYPFMTAEMGGGMAIAYHRRPLMSADDIAALDIVKLGSGVVLYGYYMFHGGTNPDGRLTTLEESQATGYPNDLPVKAYDFQAPLGEFGQMHPSFRDLKSVHLFLQDFGPSLAPMAAYFPKPPAGKMDVDTTRLAVRSDGRAAFLFLNNYQKDHPLPGRPGFQAEIQLAAGAVTVPRQPLDIPTGAYTFWPVNLAVGPAVLEYATAQPLCKLEDPGTLVFFAWPGIAAEFAFRAPGLAIEAPHAHIERQGGRIYVTGLAPGPGAAIQIRHGSGPPTRILLLSRDQARNLWKARLAGRERLILSAADLYFAADRIHLASTDPAALGFALYPNLNRAVPGFRAAGQDGLFERFAAAVDPVAAEPAVTQLAEAGPAPPVRMANEVAVKPPDEAFAAAARWRIRVPIVNSAAVDQWFLRITYQGDIARLYAGDRLVTDDFYHGAPWEIGLADPRAAGFEQGLQLQILPLRRDAPIYLAAGKPAFPKSGQLARLIQAQLVPQYRALAELRP